MTGERPRSARWLRGTPVLLALLVSGCGGPAASSPAHGDGPPGSTPPTGALTGQSAPTGVAAPGPSASPGAGNPPAHVTATVLAARLPEALSDTVVFADGPALLVAGGLTSADTSSDIVWRVDPGGTARIVGHLLAPVHDAGGATLGGTNLLFGGGTSASVRTVESVPATGAARPAGTLPEPRSDLVAVAGGGYAYLAGGYDGSRLLGDVLRTPDGRVFARMATLPVPVRYPAVATAGGVLLIAGGMTAAGTPTSVVQRVDLATGSAAVVGHLPGPLSHATGFALGGAAFLAGGVAAGGARTARILRLDPDGTVTPAGTLPGPLSDAGVAVTGNVAYLVGGERPATTATIVEIRGVAG